jgi:hypothetical protein
MTRRWCLLTSGVVMASLLGRVTPASAAEPKKFVPTITANPAVVPVEKGKTGKTTLTYDGGKQHPYVEVWVSVNGADPTRVLEAPGTGKGTKEVAVQPAKKYRYILTDFGKELASVEVKGVAASTTPTTGTNPGAGGNATSAKPEDLGAAIVKFAADRVGREGVGDGMSARLAEGALTAAGAKPGKDNVWGRAVKSGEKVLPGDIIQFTDCKFRGFVKGLAYEYEFKDRIHTAIVFEVHDVGGQKNNVVSIYHQNVDGEPAKTNSRVRRLFDLQLYDLQSGRYDIYRAQPK